jgi:hypothetical protein
MGFCLHKSFSVIVICIGEESQAASLYSPAAVAAQLQCSAAPIHIQQKPKMKFLTTNIKKVISTLNLIATAIPYIWLSFLATLAVSVRLSLGRWPIVYRDDFTRGPRRILGFFLGNLPSFITSLACSMDSHGFILSSQGRK